MTVTEERSQAYSSGMEAPFYEEVYPLIEESSLSFFRASRHHALFHIISLTLIALELILFSSLFSTILGSAFLAASFSIIFFTLFCYALLRIYMVARKGEQIEHIRDCFVMICQEQLFCPQDAMEYHKSLSYGLRKFAEELKGKEESILPLPQLFGGYFIDVAALNRFFFSADLLKMRELLLQTVVLEHLEMVKKAPINLDVHASLANAYILLANLYAEKGGKKAAKGWLKDKFRQACSSAIEEYKILLDYAPGDPWVHAQLGYIYRELEMRRQEIHEYEKIVFLRPADLESLSHLGTLYFNEGQMAKGLQIFESLKQVDESRAEDLISSYGIHLYS